MNLLTRQQLLNVNKWPCETIQTEEGTFRVAKASASGAFAIKKLSQRNEKGEDVEAEMFAEVLLACCVTDTGEALFSTREAAQSAFDCLSVETINKLALKGLALLSQGEKGSSPGKSEASQSAGSPSGSA